MKLRVFDGCTQYGSETAAFRDRGHEVVTLGIEGDVDIKCDIRQYFPSVDDHYDFMWFSPPCTEFSLLKQIPCKDRKPDMSIVDACFRIIETCKPEYWIIENPRACLRYFIGRPTVTVYYSDYGYPCRKPTDLWGVFPWFYSEHYNGNIKEFQKTTFGFNSEQKSKRSLVPYGLSLAICKAIEAEISSDYQERHHANRGKFPEHGITPVQRRRPVQPPYEAGFATASPPIFMGD